MTSLCGNLKIQAKGDIDNAIATLHTAYKQCANEVHPLIDLQQYLCDSSVRYTFKINY
jgi:hypothetical protein